MQELTQWTHSDIWSQLATTREWSFKLGDRQNERKQQKSDQRAIWNRTYSIDARRGIIRQQGVSDVSDGVRPLPWSHSGRTEIIFAVVSSVQYLLLDCIVKYTNAQPGNIHEFDDIWVRYPVCDLDNTIQAWVRSFPQLNLNWTPPNQTLQFQNGFASRKTVATDSERSKMTQQWILHSKHQEHAVVISTK